MSIYTASVPGKVILTGEHAVVYGSLATAVSIDIRTTVSLAITDYPPSLQVLSNNSEFILVIPS